MSLGLTESFVKERGRCPVVLPDNGVMEGDVAKLLIWILRNTYSMLENDDCRLRGLTQAWKNYRACPSH